jgi:glycosyltransferase involved in cell wall biosynthesis
MRILLIHQYFKVPEQGGGIRSWYIANYLKKEGHHVQVLSAHNGPETEVLVNGFQVKYFNIPYENRFGFLKRSIAFVRFVLLARNYIRMSHEWNLAYVISTPLTTGLIALFLKKRFRVPYIFEVGDLWPDVPVELGIIRNPWLKRLLKSLEIHIYDHSDILVGLSQPIVDYLEYSSNKKTPVLELPNVADCKHLAPNYDNQKWEEFVISYTGTFGFANHLEYLLDVATICKNRNLPVKFYFMGDGGRFNHIDQLARKLDNIKILPFGNKDKVSEVLLKSHAVYISFLNVPILHTGSPNKLMDGLAAGRMIISNLGGWVKKLIEENECGIYHDPEDTETFVKTLEIFINNPDMVTAFQKNARSVAIEKFDLPVFEQSLQKIMNAAELITS